MSMSNVSDALNGTRLLLCTNTSDSWQVTSCSRCGTLSLDEQELFGIYHQLQPMFTTIAFVLSIASLVGNFLVILTVLTQADRHNRSMADLFLFNVAIAHLFYSGVNVIGESLYLVQDAMTLHESCVIQPLTSLRLLTFTVSMYSLVALSIERYLATAILYININNLKVAILFLLWLLSLAVTLPLAFCDFIVNIPYTVSLAIIILSLPLLVILVLNFLLCKSSHNQVGPKPQHGDARSKRTVPMVIGLLVSLVVLWMPYLVVLVYPAVFGSISSCMEYARFLLVERSVNILAYFNPALNPILYCILSKNFRQGFKSIHRFSCPCFFEPQ